MKRLAVIPARGGSKRIPKKNIKDFCGRPMIAHALSVVAEAGVFEEIHVSTDCPEVVEKAEEAGYAPAFLRPDHLADDHTSMLEVCRFVLEEFEARNEVFDTVSIIYATSPLVSPKDLWAACLQFEQGDVGKPLLAVAQFPAPIEHAFRMDPESDKLVPASPELLVQRTQDLPHAYHDAGMFAFFSSAFVRSSVGAGDFEAFRGYVVPGFRVTDIDWPEDWERAENLKRALGRGPVGDEGISE